MSAFFKIEKALLNAVNDMGLPYPTSLPNKELPNSDKENGLWLKVSILNAQTNVATLGTSGTDNNPGILQIDINVLQNKGAGKLLTVADILCTKFYAGLGLHYEGEEVRITRSSVSGIRNVGGYARRSVTVNWFCRTKRFPYVYPPAQWVAQLDGAMQGWVLSQYIQCEIGDLIRFKNIGPAYREMDSALLGRENSYSAAAIFRQRLGGVLETNGGSLYIDDHAVSAGSTYPVIGPGYASVEFTPNSRIKIQTIGCVLRNKISQSILWCFPGVFFDFELIRNGKVIYSIPLTNKEQGPIQQPLIGDIYARMIGYDSSAWVPYDSF